MPEEKIFKNGNEERIQFPDLIELWKKIYFKSEEAYTNMGKEFVSSNAFVTMLGQIRDQYLSQHKISTQTFEKYLDTNPIASKKDIARIAELIIALEDKQDKFDLQFTNNLDSIADSLIRLVNLQQAAKNDAIVFKKDISVLNEKLDQIDLILKNLPSGKTRQNNENEIMDERRDSLD